MAVRFRKPAIKFLRKANPDDVRRIQMAIRELVIAIEERQSIPFEQLNIKKMKGQWQGFYRLRIGDIRIIFTVEQMTIVIIYAIGPRGDIYK